MKSILNFTVLIIFNTVLAQQYELRLSFHIKSDTTIESVTFRNFRGNHTFIVEDNTSLNFNSEYIEEYFIKVKTKDSTFQERIWLDQGDIDLSISLLSNRLKLNIQNSEIYTKSNEFYSEFEKLKSRNAEDKEINKFLKNQLKKNINNPFSHIIGLNIFFKNQNNLSLLSELMNTINSQPESVKNHYNSGLLIKTLKSKLNNSQINLSDYRFLDKLDEEHQILFQENEYVLLDFWHTACPPCIKDHAEMKTIINHFDEKKIKIVSISSDQGNRIETWKNYLKTKELQWENYIEKKTNSLTDELSIRIFPTYILLDRNYNIVDYTNSFSEIKKRLSIN